ncbi:MAG TPA: ABC transporter permease subunit [Candidatus Limnocylindria bacterium]|nr:ABC transporter permease subunit [Candidatus Limnocylindria bacterium]
MLRLLRSEVYRLVRRWMPWVLLGITVLLAFLLYELVWLTTNAQLEALRSGSAPANPNAPPPEVQIRSIEGAIQTLRPAQLTRLGVGLVAGLGTIVVIVFSASHLGTEWVWGTLRTVLAAGAGRAQLLASKYLTLVGFALVYVVVGLAATTAASFLVSSQAGLDTSGYDIGVVASAGARTLFGFLPYMALAALIALWFRSAGGGIAAGLVINFTESLVTQLLVQFNKDFVSVANFGISRNVQAISRVADAPPAGANPSVLATLPDQTQAVVVLVLWTILFVALGFWRLRTRDITLS